MDNPEKLVTYGTQDEEKQNTNTMCMLRIKNTKTLWFLWLLLTGKLLNQGFLLIEVEVITSNVLWSPPWLGWPIWNICVTNDHGYVPLVNTSQSFPRSWLIINRSLVICVMFCRSLFVIFLFTIVLPVFLRFAESDYPFGIFKLFFQEGNRVWNVYWFDDVWISFYYLSLNLI